jgi:Rrf2 family iron-sulfur cluster assembly transcriptional regulator
VSSTRGPGGGYTLTSNADEISVSDIITAVDENCSVVDCNSSDSCHGTDYQCLTHDLWQELSSEIRTFLEGITLSEIMSRQSMRNCRHPQDTVVNV